jgi:hypothetical protein
MVMHAGKQNVANTSPDAIKLRVNGTLLATGVRPAMNQLDAPLRGVALSDSPVLVRATREDDRSYVTGRLHALGRRADQPLHVCKSVDDARSLINNGARGTWALHDVASWTVEEQNSLAKLLAMLDQHRLHGNLSHDRIPRIVVIEGPDATKKLAPALIQRLSFFDIALG